MTNADIATVFNRIAAILAIRGENPFRIRAYERAAVMITGMPDALADTFARGGRAALDAIPGIGVDLTMKIEELLRTGRLAFDRELRRSIPAGLLVVMDVEGMGPKRTKFVFEEFGVRNLRDLERLCRSGALTRVRGWGERSVANILHAIDMLRRFGERMPLGVALPLAESLARTLERSRLCDRVEIAGSIRRRRETIGDIDLLATSAQPQRVMDLFCASPLVQRVIAKGPTKANVLLKSGIEADLRVLDRNVFGAGLYYFTGSKLHNVRTRMMAIRKGLTINEYGVFRGTKDRKGKRVACRTEEDVFRAIGLPYIPPEIREDTGEVDAALAGKLPRLITEDDIRGDLHAHSDVSDGSASMEEMIAAAKRAGLTYVAITDHASIMGMVRGIADSRKPIAHPDRNVGTDSRKGASSISPPPHRGGARATLPLPKEGEREGVAHHRAGGSGSSVKMDIGTYVKRVRTAERKVGGIHVLAGAEVDIRPDGSLYLSDAELRQLDWVIGAIHQSFRQTPAGVTARLLRAMEHPYLHAIAHPTTRIIGERAGIEFQWDALFRRARERGIVWELNAAWQRLDLDDVHCRQAKAAGVRIAVNSDAHTVLGFDFRYGVSQARRGWLERGDIVNTMPWPIFERWLRRRR